MKRAALMPVLALLALLPGSVLPETVKVGNRANGKTQVLRVGDTIEVTLLANPSTGYSWEVQPLDENVLKLAGKGTVKAKKKSIGANEVVFFRFEALAEGTVPLKLIYQRPFEKEKPPAKIYQITVVVRPA